MANISHLIASHIPRIDPPEVQLRNAMISAGQTPPPTIFLDGILHRYDDQKEHGDALWYVAFDDDIPGGAFGNWRAGEQTNWRGDIGRELTMVESMALRARHDESRAKAETERQIRQGLAADNCAEIWAGLTAATDHPYLIEKGIRPHMARVNGRGELVIPMYIDGAISSLQTIGSDRRKLFHPGGKVKGASLHFGATGPRVYLAEGFATAATIYEETGTWTVAAFSAQNLVEVAGQLRQDAALELIIVADNDASGTGQNYANQAAAKYGATVIMPPNEGQDANDYRKAGGDLLFLIDPPKQESWLVNGDEFTQSPAPIKWIVKKWLQSDSLMMIHGPSGSGKTFIVLDWCLRLAAGMEDWHGHKVRPCPVVYLAGEGHHGVKGRMAAWRHHHAPGASLKAIHVSRSGCDLNTPAGLQKVLTQIRELPEPPGLVVVDTLHRFLAGDENSAEDAKTMLDACAVVQSTFGCSVLLVHHTGVSEESQHRARGSSAWRGALDIEISVQPGKGAIAVTQRKSKDAELAQDIFVELQAVVIPGWIDEDGEPVTSAVIIEGQKPAKEEKPDAAWKSFSDAWYESGREPGPYLSRSAWEHHMVTTMGLSQSTARQHVKPSAEGKFASRLVMAGKIKTHENGFLVIDPALSSAMTLMIS